MELQQTTEIELNPFHSNVFEAVVVWTAMRQIIGHWQNSFIRVNRIAYKFGTQNYGNQLAMGNEDEK